MPKHNEIADLKAALDTRYAELREKIRQELLQSDEEHFIDLAGQVHDLQDESLADLLVDLGLEIIDMHLNEVREIEAALARIASDEYGDCMDCGGEIETDRLQAYPTARRCWDCQSKYEKSHAVPNHSTM
ncbi:MAG: TraR/DksA family transcriptional regulator [Xanthomonadales bacterium]